MKTLLQRVRSIYLALSVTTYGRVTKHVDQCPHCHERTTWAVRILTDYARCLECGRNPLDHDDQSPMSQGAQEASAPSRACIPA